MTATQPTPPQPAGSITREQYSTIMRLAQEYADSEARLASGMPLKYRHPDEIHDELNRYVADLIDWSVPAREAVSR